MLLEKGLARRGWWGSSLIIIGCAIISKIYGRVYEYANQQAKRRVFSTY